MSKGFCRFLDKQHCLCIKIANQNETTFDTVNYDLTTKEDQVLVRDGDKLISQEENVLGEAIEDVLQATIQEARSQPEDTFVKVVGVVTAEPDLVGNDIYYIQDESGGIQISNESNANLKIGDEVQIIGSISSYHSEIRITTETEDKIGSLDPPDPKEVKVNEFISDLAGTLVTITEQ